MALVRTNRWGENLNLTYTGSPITFTSSSSFTPSANSLLVVGWSFLHQGADINDNSWSASAGGSAMTKRMQVGELNSGDGFSSVISLWTIPIGASPSSMTVTVSSTTNAGPFSNCALSIFDYTGYNSGTPIGATGSGTALGEAAGSISLSGAPASTSVALGARHFVPNGFNAPTATPGSAFTEIHDVAASGLGGLETEDRGGSTSTTVDWLDLDDTGDTAYMCHAIAMEIKAAGAAAAASLPIFRRPLRMMNRRYP